MSSSQPFIVCESELTEFFRRTRRFCRKTQPRFDTQTINQTMTSVIENQWLELMSDEEITCLIEERPEVRDLIISKGKEGRDHMTWNLAGALVQTGGWRRFYSSEHARMMLATFWGMKAPELVPTCTTWQVLKDNEQPIRLTKMKRHLAYLKQYRDTLETVFRPCPRIPSNQQGLHGMVRIAWEWSLHEVPRSSED